MGIEKLISNAANLVIPMFPDLCSLINEQYINDGAGGSVLDPASVIISGIPCVFEPLRHYPRFRELPTSAILSQDATHLIIMKLTADTIAIQSNYLITIAARGIRKAFIFEQPQRMDEDLSPVILIAAILRNQ